MTGQRPEKRPSGGFWRGTTIRFAQHKQGRDAPRESHLRSRKIDIAQIAFTALNGVSTGSLCVCAGALVGLDPEYRQLGRRGLKKGQ